MFNAGVAVIEPLIEGTLDLISGHKGDGSEDIVCNCLIPCELTKALHTIPCALLYRIFLTVAEAIPQTGREGL